jgi:type VI secretion system secreted protein Hcp
MAIDAYVKFIPYTGSTPDSESQVDFSNNNEDIAAPFKSSKVMTTANGMITQFGQVFEIKDYSFDIEQTYNLGSQSGGAGAGKVTFNPFSITRAIDRASPVFFEHACGGTAFQMVHLGLRKSGGTGASGSTETMTSGVFFLRFDFKLVVVKTISWSHDDESPQETVTFEYGGLQIRYAAQNPNGSLYATKAGGWNRVQNKQDILPNPI